MEPLILLIEPELDQRAAAATMSRAQKVYEEGARDISRVMRTQITEGTTAAGRGFEEMETKARRAYLGMQDAGEKVAAAERKLEAARERGASNTEALARRVERARLDEIQAIERATSAYRDYENAAQNAGQAGENAGQSILGGLRDAVSGAGQSGGDMANDFVGGFASSSALMRLGAAGGPIGLALAGVVALGVTAGKVLADNISAGLQSLQMQNLFQARLGVDDGTMAQYGESAAKAYTDMWGASVEDNLRAVQFGVQAGVINPGASDSEIQNTIAQMQTLATVMEVDVQDAARAAGQLMRGGFAADGTQAADIIAAGFQNGLDISGDWLDTITEYSTQFRKLGLDGQDAIGLITQGLRGGARDSDIVADSLKEFSIRAVDGSKSTAEGFAAIGFNADEMAQKFLAGGQTARSAFDATLQAIRNLEDPQQQALAWVSLFGTQWEDMGDAANQFDLSKARAEFTSTEGAITRMTTKLSENANGWDALGRNIDTTFGKLQKWLADSDIGKFLSQGVPGFANDLLFPDAQGDAQSQLAAAQQAEAERRAMGSGFANAGDAQRARRGSTAPAGITPGARTPILTETQQQAADAAEEAAGGTGLPGAPSLPLQYTSTAGLPSNIANATTRLDEARHAVAEKEARVNQLMQSNNADADDVQKARNDLAKANQDQLQAEQSLTDARINATEKANKQLTGLSNDLSEMGNQLDADFGLSKGLGGFIENVVKAFGNALTAPLMAALGMVEKANPNEGSGLIGIGAANGMFGSQYTPQAIAAMQASGSGGAAGYSGGMVVPGGSGGPPSEAQVKAIAAQFGLQVTSEDRPGDPGYHGQGMALDISNGSGNTPEMRAFAEYMSQNFGSSLKELIYSDGSFSGQIGDGKNVAGTGYYSPGTLGEHENHVHIAAAWGDSATQATSALTNLAGAAQNATSLWDAVAAEESGGNWGNQDTGNNGHFGGLQFSPETWNAYGGTELTGQSNPANASREEQIAIANRTAFTGHNGLAPQGLGAWEVITNGSVPGVGVNTPASAFGAGMAAPTGTGIYGGPGVAGVPGMPGGGMPGIGMPQSMPMGGAGAGGQAYPSTGGNSGNVVGGIPLDAAMAATAALDTMAPGSSAAAKIGIQLANRAVGYAAQNAGIAGSGVLETLSLGDNPKGNLGASWLGKGLGGIAGAAAALPNIAGGKPPGPMDQAGGGDKGKAGNTYGDTNIQVQAREGASGQEHGEQIAAETSRMYAQPGKQ